MNDHRRCSLGEDSQARVVPLPIDEDRRVDSLHRLNLLDTPAEERFDRVTRLARRVLDVPVVTIGLVDSTREWFKSAIGMPYEQIARRASFSTLVVADERTVVSSDTRKDPRFEGNPLVTGEPYVRSFAGHPLRSKDGSTVGALVVYDFRPRDLSEADLSSLRDLAAIIDSEISVSTLTPALRELMTQTKESGETRIDSLTRLWNRSAVLDIIDREILYAKEVERPLSLVLVDIDQLKTVNDKFGTEKGDEVLVEVARRMRATLRPYDSTGRYGGEEFLILLPDADQQSAWSAAERVRADIAEAEILPGICITVAIGIATGARDTSRAGDLVRQAERSLFEAKKSGGNRVYAGK